jgi:hypothetical protein
VERRWRPGTHGLADPDGPAGPQEDWRDKYGRGWKDPVTGDYEWYDIPEAEKEDATEDPVTWNQLLGHWNLIVPDLLAEYRVDVYDRQLMKTRPWSWLEALIIGLLDKTSTRLWKQVAKDRKQDPPPAAGGEDEEEAAWR